MPSESPSSPSQSKSSASPVSPASLASPALPSPSGFEGLGLDPALCGAVASAFQIQTPSDIQEKAVRAALALEAPRDVLIRSRTGSGKTLAFLLPILHSLLVERRAQGGGAADARSAGTLAVIVVPTRELAAQTHQAVSGIIAKLKGRDHWPICATLSGGDRRKSEKAALRKGVHIVVGTPGRLLDHLQNTQKWTERVSMSCRWVVLDEADRLLDSGFEKSVSEILTKITAGRSKREMPQILLCSATVDGSRKDIFGYELNQPLLIAESGKPRQQPKTTETVDSKDNSGSPSSEVALAANTQLEHHYVCSPTKFRLAALLGYLEELFSKPAGQKVLLFSICCDTVDFLTALLGDPTLKLLPAAVKLSKLHGNLEHKTRLETFARFTKETTNCLLVCTDVAARGLNLSHVTCIVQFDAPCDINDYIHRAGRTARQQETGKSVLFLMPSERDYIAELQKKGLDVKCIKWEPSVERIAQKVDAKLLGKLRQLDDAGSDDEQAALVNADLRKKIFAWLADLQERIQKKGELFQLAQKAFLSFARAYSTHPAAEKSIFHVKKLHLGHLAETFLLAEAPKAVAAHHQKDAKKGSDGPARRGDGPARYGNSPVRRGDGPARRGDPTGKQRQQFKPNGNRPATKRRAVSEFDAGDIAHMQPRRKKA